MAAIVVLKDNVKLYLHSGTGDIALADKIGHISQIGDVGAGAKDEIDTTTIDSMAREFELGFEDPGTVQITQNVTDSEYTTMKGYLDSGETLKYGLTVADKAGTHILGLTGQCMVSQATLTGISVGGLVQVNTTLRLTGAITATFTDPTA